MATADSARFTQPTRLLGGAPGPFAGPSARWRNSGTWEPGAGQSAKWTRQAPRRGGAEELPITERVQTAFRAAFFNFPNHLSYTGISSTYTSSTFGQITGATDTRTMEFALRVTF